MSEDVFCAGILIEKACGALSAWYMPCSAIGALGQQAYLIALLAGQGFQFMVFLFHLFKETVCSLFHTKEHTIHSNPFGSCQRRYLHVIGAFHDGYVHLLQTSVSALAFVWRRHQKVGTEVHYLLYVDGIAIAQIANISRREPLVQIFVGKIVHIKDTTDMLSHTQFLQQGSMRGAIHGSILYGCLHADASQDSGGVPWIPYLNPDFSIQSLSPYQFCVFEGDGFSLGGGVARFYIACQQTSQHSPCK